MIDFYETIDEDNVSLRCDVDMDLIEQAPQEERPWLLWIFIKSSNPLDSSFQDFINDLKDQLHTEIDSVFAGSVIKEGWVEVYFYAPSSKRFENLSSDVMSRHGGFAYERGSSRDGKWEMYIENLYPDAYEVLGMQNRHTIESLIEAGDDLNKEREVEHYLFFQTKSSLERAVSFLGAHGLNEKERIDNEEGDYAYGVVLVKTESLSAERVEETTSLCFDTAVNEHGHYEGWSTVLG